MPLYRPPFPLPLRRLVAEDDRLVVVAVVGVAPGRVSPQAA